MLHGLRVLIVEDEALIAEELRERLSGFGMTIVGTVDSAHLAVTAAAQVRPGLVLMDIRIRGARDGVEAAAEIRRHVDVPVVFLTAHSDRTTFDRAKEAAPFGYVLKPFHERELLVAIEMAVHRHSLERQLKDSERKYVATLASIGDGVIATDLQERVTFMNPVAEALTGWRFSDARGLAADEVFQVARDPRGASRISPIRDALQGRRSVRFDTDDLFLFSTTNEAIPIDDCAAPIVDDQGQATGAVVTFRDIRDRRLATDALQRAQDELLQSQKMESVGRLAAGIAHDFNNLLTVVNGCTGLAMEDETLGPTTRALLGDVVKAGAHATALTRQFLAFGQRQMLQPKVVDLTSLAAGLPAILGRLIGEGIRLIVTSAQPPVSVFADPGQLEQVIVNLAVNGRDAMPAGGTLTITTSHATIDVGAADANGHVPPGRYAALTVTDTGGGIGEAIRDHIFEPYLTTKHVGRGSGLGLATVYGIVKQSGGFIEVDSEPARGTSFTIYLPLVADGAPRDVPPDISTVVERGRETVLVVDDEEPVRSLLAVTLRKHGYTVIEASDGDDALRQFERYGPIHLVVTDVVMAGMRGPALVERLLALNHRLRVLYMSGYAGDALPLGSGAAFMQKPFVPSALAHTVRELLDR